MKAMEGTLISFCLPVCFFAKLLFQTSLFVFLLFVDLFCSQNTSVSFLGICFAGRRGFFVVSYLLLLLVLLFGQQPSFGLNLLLCLDSLGRFSFLFELFLFFWGVLFCWFVVSFWSLVFFLQCVPLSFCLVFSFFCWFSVLILACFFRVARLWVFLCLGAEGVNLYFCF